MTEELNEGGVFSLPKTPTKANQVFYAMVLSGLVFVPVLLLSYHRLLEPVTKVSLKDFFLIFTVLYLLCTILCNSRANDARTGLLKKLGNGIARDLAVITPAAANSGDANLIEHGRRYWKWQLISGFISGTYFSWVASIFFVIFS